MCKQIIAFVFVIPLLLASAFTVCQELSIPANSTFRVLADRSELRLERLTIGDNARIEFAPGVERWTVDAMQAVIGDQVVIDGRGQLGKAGGDGAGFAEVPATNCEDGKFGDNADGGEPGGNGVDIRLRLGLQALGSVRIDTSGGTGGDGGQGGRGQSLDQSDCDKSDGGDGGQGGAGGDGGDGGNIWISWWDSSGEGPDIANVEDKFSLITEAGVGGQGGAGGARGKGSPGKYVNKKSLYGNRTWVAGGDDGIDGKNGDAGKRGRGGLTELQYDPLLSQSAATPNPTTTTNTATTEHNNLAADLRSEINQLRSEMRRLQQRLEALEAQQNP